jgi:hypothetical protein
VVYDHAFGLNPETLDLYVASLDQNHYWKNLILGPIKTAQARDQNNNVIYEVVYSEIQDNQVNTIGESTSKTVILPYAAVVDDVSVQEVYPNSLINMRNQVIDTVGKISDILPAWMTSKQADGRVLGFVPAWVICYCKPGTSGVIAYNITQNQFDVQLNRIDFEVDRYTLDRRLSKNWDPEVNNNQGAWVPTPAATTFDLQLHYATTAIPTAGINYNIGDQILIVGSSVGGIDGLNDIVVTVQDIGSLGSITIINIIGIAPLLSLGSVYNNISGTNIETGFGAQFAVCRVNTQYIVSIQSVGSGYKVGDRIVILGSQLGGVDTVNDCTITINRVSIDGNISGITFTGTAVPGVEDYVGLSGVKINGLGATFNFVVTSGDATVFDKNSLRFISPVDIYTVTDSFDKYLVFPKTNILE